MRNARWSALLLVGLLLLFLGAPAARGAETELARDDGHRAGKLSSAGTGHVVSFEASKAGMWLRSVKIHGQRYGGNYDAKEEHFQIAVQDKHAHRIASFEAPYIHFPPGAWKWVEIVLPRCVRVPKEFQVVVSFDPTQTKGVFVGWAETTGSFSGSGLPSQVPQPVEGKAWMIRANVVKKPLRGVVKERLLSIDDGEREGEKSLAGSGHVVELKRPAGKWWIQSVLVNAKRYGGGYNPRTTNFTVSIADAKMKPLQVTTGRYVLFDTDWAWVEVPLEEPIQAPSKFRVALDFDPTRTKGVYVAYSKARKPRSYTGETGRLATPFPGGDWMVRVRLVSEKPEPPEPMTLAHDPEVYLEDLAFVRKTVADHFPAFEKKGVDWDALCDEAKPRFATCVDDEAHIKEMYRLLAHLGDSHTGITETEFEVHVPAFDGLYGAGMWIAREGDQLILRALMDGHKYEKKLGPGALLLAIEGKPALLVHEDVRRQVREWIGYSSDHFLDARLSFQFFPFGKKKTIVARFLNTDGQILDLTLDRWGPGGRGLSRQQSTMPHGVEAKGRVVTHKLAPDIGYVRILGGMNEETVKAFHEAMSKVKGVRAIVLDCRGMGGGGDQHAWAMAGRFYERTIPFKHDPELRPTGDWQFAGPVVMLMDEREISSAETFTWALAETKRAVTVGRPTGGATIIPRVFAAPSSLFSFRLGCRDRPTSVLGVHPEGRGTEPDVFVAYSAAALQRFHDPVLAAGHDLARLLTWGSSRSTVTCTYAGILGIDPPQVLRCLPEWRGTKMPEDLVWEDLTTGFLDAQAWWAVTTTTHESNLLPDVLAEGRTLDRITEIAHACGRAEWAQKAINAASILRAERSAQAAFHELRARGWPPEQDDLDMWLAEHAGTRWANTIERYLE